MCFLLEGKDPAALGALVLHREKAGSQLGAVGVDGQSEWGGRLRQWVRWPFKLSARLPPNLKLAGLCGSTRGPGVGRSPAPGCLTLASQSAVIRPLSTVTSVEKVLWE